MSPGVWLTTFDVDALLDLLRAESGRLLHVYLESESQAQFGSLTDFLADPPRFTVPRWRAGRAFGPLLEIRWRRVDRLSIDCEALTESEPPTTIRWTASEWNARLESVTRQRDLLMIEPRDARLRCLDYIYEGMVVLTRLCSITDQA